MHTVLETVAVILLALIVSLNVSRRGNSTWIYEAYQELAQIASFFLLLSFLLN
jgi:hypothetical protein